MKRGLNVRDIAELQTPRVGPWLRAAMLDWSAIVAAMVIARWVDHWFVYVLAVVVIGAAQHGLSQLGHEGTHYLISRRRALNDILPNVLCWWPVLVSGHSYRKAHLAHHRHLGTDQDPERIHGMQRAPTLPVTRLQVVRDCVLNVLGLNMMQAFRLYRVIAPARVSDVFGMLGMWGALLGGAYWTGAYWVPLLWVAAMPTTFWMLSNLRIWAEHTGIDVTYRYQMTWWQKVLFLPHNVGYHYEHHAYASVPFWALPRVRELDRSAPVVPSFGALVSSFERSNTVPVGARPAGDAR